MTRSAWGLGAPRVLGCDGAAQDPAAGDPAAASRGAEAARAALSR